MGAEGFHGRVRNGIGCWDLRYGHQVVGKPEGAAEVCRMNRCVCNWHVPCGLSTAARGVGFALRLTDQRQLSVPAFAGRYVLSR